MIFDEIGEMALGSRLRMLSETVTKDAKHIYNLYGIELKPNWFPIFYFLSQDRKEKSITEIAKKIKHSHPSVIKIIKEMVMAGIVVEKKSKTDKRKNNITLTRKGIALSTRIERQYIDVNSAIRQSLSQTKHNLWIALQEFESVLHQKSIYSRVLEQKKIRETNSIKIVDYLPKYKKIFKELNEAWIVKHFKIEDADRIALENPEEYIINKGGSILIALEGDTVLGVCALIKMTDSKYDYELAKMAVATPARGKGIGYLLSTAIIEKAIFLKAKNIYLESNTILKAAISLYKKLGFKKIIGHQTPYERCNIQMELTLK